MMNQILKVMLVLILVSGLFGCNSVGKVMSPNDQVLTYKLAYDQTYLKTLEALNSQADWQLDATDKEKGIISVRNVNYSRLDDSDLRSISFIVKRVDIGTTSVNILPDTQHVYGGQQLLKVIGEALSREVKS